MVSFEAGGLRILHLFLGYFSGYTSQRALRFDKVFCLLTKRIKRGTLVARLRCVRLREKATLLRDVSRELAGNDVDVRHLNCLIRSIRDRVVTVGGGQARICSSGGW